MKAVSLVVLVVLSSGSLLPGSETLDRARQMMKAGDANGARNLLAQAARSNPNTTTLTEYAEFLDHFGDPGARAAYARLLDTLGGDGDAGRRAAAAARLASWDLMAGDRAAAARSLDAYRSAGGRDLALPAAAAQPAASPKGAINIPGPLRSFSRMAAISTDLLPDDILPAVARNVVTNGYQASHSNDALEQTEYLKLVHRYLSQARELEKLGGADKVIRIETCDSNITGDLLKILGYRMRGGCGSEVVLDTVNASRAFLTTDSGFPLAELEQALRTNRPFVLDYKPTSVPVMYSADYWLSAKEKAQGEFIDIFLSDPSLCRLYLGFSKLDRPSPTPAASSTSPKTNCHMGRAGHQPSSQSPKVTRLFGSDRNFNCCSSSIS